MRLNREQFLAAAVALSAGLGGCKLGAKGDDATNQAAPESPGQTTQPATGPQGAPADPAGNSGSGADPNGRERTENERGTPPSTDRGTTQTKGLVGSPAKELGASPTSPTKELGSPVKEVTSPTKEITSPTKEITSPTKELTPPTKEKLPPPTKEVTTPTKKPPPSPVKEL